MSGFNEKGLTKKPRVTFEERRAREKAVANYAMAQAAGVGPLAPLFGIEPRKPEPAPRAKPAPKPQAKPTPAKPAPKKPAPAKGSKKTPAPSPKA